MPADSFPFDSLAKPPWEQQLPAWRNAHFRFLRALHADTGGIVRCTETNIRGFGVEIGNVTSARAGKGGDTATSAGSPCAPSVAVSAQSGASMAVAAARQALESSYGSHDRTSQVGLHLHSSMWERGDFYSVACSMHRQLNLPAGMVAEINAMSNSMGLALELAASVLQSRDDVGDALVTAGEQFAEPRFPRLTADFGVVYGDAGAALVLSRAPGIARVRSVATVADTSLEGLNRRTVRDPVDGVAPLDLRSRKRSWFASHGGPEVVVQRSVRAVRRVVGQALADAGIGLLDARWVLLPFFGEKIMREQYLDPLQIPRSRTLVDLGLRFGHLGAADNVVALHHLWSNKMVGLGDSVVLVSSGVGMTWTAAVLEFTRDPISSSSA